MRTLLTSLAIITLLTGCGDEDVDQASKPLEVSSVSVPTRNLPAFFDCLDAEGKTWVSAHRGGPAPGYPENALPTLIRTAEQNGIPLLEIDIRTSADGVLYLFHDDVLDYETTGRGLVAEMKWEDLREVSLKDARGQPTAYRLSRFDEVLNWAEGKAILQLDIKRDTKYADVAFVVDAAQAGERVIPIAYSRGQAGALARSFPNSMISVSINNEVDLNALIERGVPENRMLAWTGIEAVRPDLNQLLDERNIEAAFGTLGGRTSIDKDIKASGDDTRYADIAAKGVDIIASDRPVAARDALIAAGRWPTKGTCAAN